MEAIRSLIRASIYNFLPDFLHLEIQRFGVLFTDLGDITKFLQNLGFEVTVKIIIHIWDICTARHTFCHYKWQNNRGGDGHDRMRYLYGLDLLSVKSLFHLTVLDRHWDQYTSFWCRLEIKLYALSNNVDSLFRQNLFLWSDIEYLEADAILHTRMSGSRAVLLEAGVTALNCL